MKHPRAINAIRCALVRLLLGLLRTISLEKPSRKSDAIFEDLRESLTITVWWIFGALVLHIVIRIIRKEMSVARHCSLEPRACSYSVIGSLIAYITTEIEETWWMLMRTYFTPTRLGTIQVCLMDRVYAATYCYKYSWLLSVVRLQSTPTIA